MAAAQLCLVVLVAVAGTSATVNYPPIVLPPPPPPHNKCGHLHGVQKLNLAKITGDWYVVELLTPHAQDRGRCLRERLVQIGPHSVSANSSGLNYDGLCFSRMSTAIACELPNPSNAFAIIRGCEFRLTGIETDYIKYLAASFCQESADGSIRHFAFIWARRDCLPDKLIEKLRSKIVGWGADVTHMYRVDQYDCPTHCIPINHAKCY